MIFETFQKPWDYELLDSGEGFRLEQWGNVRLQRPDPQAIWQLHLPKTEWDKADAVFKSKWSTKRSISEPWNVQWGDTTLLARLTNFKHTGIFAEQAANWEWAVKKLKIDDARFKNEKHKITNHKSKILNLFGYTGAASVILAQYGHFVTHVDASKPAITWAKENQAANNLPTDSIRWILDDAVKFVKRELKRGQHYDAILMDPPAFGHGPTGKTWKFEEHFPELLADCAKLLSPNARFLLVNAYATNSSALALQNVMEDAFAVSPPAKREYTRQGGRGFGTIESGELCLKQKDSRLLSTGIFARWQQN